MQYMNLLLYLIIPFSELTVIPLFSFLFHIFAVIGSSAVFLLELKHVGKCKIYFANIHYQCFSFFFFHFPLIVPAILQVNFQECIAWRKK